MNQHPEDVRHRASQIARDATRSTVHPDVSFEDVNWLTDTIEELCDELERGSGS